MKPMPALLYSKLCAIDDNKTQITKSLPLLKLHIITTA